jgi:hypothetical protein
MAHGVSPGSDDIKLDGKEVEDEEVFHDMEQDDTTEGAGGAAEEKKAKSTSANAEVPSPAPSELPEKKEKEEADWKFVSKRQIGGRRKEGRYSLMVTNAPLDVAEKLARNLFPAESRKKRLIWLDNKANSEWKLHEQVHRLSFLTLTDEQAQEKLIRNGLTAARLRQWVMLGPEWSNACYRVDEGREGRNLSELRPARPEAWESKSTVLPKVGRVWDVKSGNTFTEDYPPLPQTKPTPMHDAAYKEELREVRKEVEKVRSWVEQVLSSRETDRNSKVPDEANTLFQNELADVKKQNGKLKEEQLRAAAAAEAEAARLAQLAAQHQAHIERLEQELEALKARLEEKSAQINRLENARDEAAEGYRTPQRYTEQHQESESEDGSDKSETRAAAAAATRFYKNYNFDDESGVNPHDQATMDYLTALARQVEAKQKSRKGKRAVNLHKKQGATPSTHRTPVSGGPRRRDQVEPTGETPTQPNTRSKSEEQ